MSKQPRGEIRLKFRIILKSLLLAGIAGSSSLAGAKDPENNERYDSYVAYVYHKMEEVKADMYPDFEAVYIGNDIESGKIHFKVKVDENGNVIYYKLLSSEIQAPAFIRKFESVVVEKNFGISKTIKEFEYKLNFELTERVKTNSK